MCDQRFDKLIMHPTGTSTAEKSKCIEWDYPKIYLITQGNRAQDILIQIYMAQEGSIIIGYHILIISEPTGKKLGAW